MFRQTKRWKDLHRVLVIQLGHVCDDEIEGPVTSGGYTDELFQFELCQKATDVKLVKVPCKQNATSWVEPLSS